MTSISVQQQQRYQARGGISNLGAQEQLMVEYGNQLLVKCVVVGDHGVGKSHLICARASGVKYSLRDLVLQTNVSSVWAVDQYRENPDVWRRSHCDIDGVSCSLRIWDTFGNHDRDRQFAYLRTDVVVICFSAINRRSLLNIEKFWIPEVHRMCGSTVPIVICGCQIDYRYLFHEPAYINLDKGPFAKRFKAGDAVLPEEGRAVARKFGACYYETSVLAQYGIDDVFNNAVRACLFRKRRAQIFSKIGNLKHVTKPHLQVPHLPPKPAQPEFETPAPPAVGLLRPSRSRHDLQSYCDVKFVVEGGIPFYAHWVYLIAASPSFHQLYQRRCQPLDLSRSDFISVGTSGDSGTLRSQSSSNSTLSGWLPPWRRDGVRIRMSSRIRYLSQNLTATATPKKATADDSLSVNETTTGRQMADSTSDLLAKSASLMSPSSGHQPSDRRASLQVDDDCYEEGVFDARSHASSAMTLKALDSSDCDDDEDDDEDGKKNDDDAEDDDRVTEFSDIDSGYTNHTSLATSVTCLPSTAFVSVNVRVGSGGVAEESVIVIDEEISAQTFEDVLHYIYTGDLPPEGDDDLDFDRLRFDRLHRAARAMGITDLETATANVLNRDAFLNVELESKVEADRIQRMEQLFIKQGLLADVLFELEDGTVPAHRALLMCRSDMMVSMFNLDFTERASKTVPFRGATAGGFRGLIYYLYTERCPQFCDDWASMIELADRLLLPKLLNDIQLNCINHLNKIMSSLTDELTEAVLVLIDAAKLHKTEQVERWCQWYLQVNFNEVIEKHVKTFEALHPDTQATLLNQRWPPEWYLKEVDVYERALMLMTREKPEASWLKRPNGEVHDTSHCFGFLRKK